MVVIPACKLRIEFTNSRFLGRGKCPLKGTWITLEQCVICPVRMDKTAKPNKPVSIVTSWLHVSDNLEATLPPTTGADRIVHFETDGSIRYEKGGSVPENAWEPPRDISGYASDPDNPWRFLPLWKPCALRHQSAVRYPACGCINVIMRCNSPECNQFAKHVGHEICLTCKWRKP